MISSYTIGRNRACAANSPRLLIVVLLSLLLPSIADAQVRSLGSSVTGEVLNFPESMAVAYDDAHDVTLQVYVDGGHIASGAFPVLGRFARSDGSFAGESFVIANFGATPLAAYSSGSAGDVFVVLFHVQPNTYLQRVRYTGDGGVLLGAPVRLGFGVPGDVIFNPATHTFLATWYENPGEFSCPEASCHVWIQLLDEDGQDDRDPVAVSQAYPRDSSLLLGSKAAYDPINRNYLVAFTIGGSGAAPETYVRLLDGVTGQPAGPAGELASGCAAGYSICPGTGHGLHGLLYLAKAQSFLAVLAIPGSGVVSIPVSQDGAPGEQAPVAQLSGRATVIYNERADRVVLIGRQNGGAPRGQLAFVTLDASGQNVRAPILFSEVVNPVSLAACNMAGGRLAVAYSVYPHAAMLGRFALSDSRGYIDRPTPSSSVGPVFRLEGWTADLGASLDAGIDTVHAWAFPADGGEGMFLGAIKPDLPRPDVALALGSQFLTSGFAMTTAALPPGSFSVRMFAHTVIDDTFLPVAERSISIVSSLPAVRLDLPPSASLASPIRIAGWAVDRAVPPGSGAGVDVVHVWAFPPEGAARFVGEIPVDQERPDIASAYGSPYLTSGFVRTFDLPPGAYSVVAFARSTVTGTFTASNASSVVVVPAPDPRPYMAVDEPTDGSPVSRGFVVRGWAVDSRATGGTGVDAIHVWAFPVGTGEGVFLGVAEYGSARTDIEAALGSPFLNAGFTLATSPVLAPGQYDVVVYARSTVDRTFNQQRIVRVTVQ